MSTWVRHLKSTHSGDGHVEDDDRDHDDDEYSFSISEKGEEEDPTLRAINGKTTLNCLGEYNLDAYLSVMYSIIVYGDVWFIN